MILQALTDYYDRLEADPDQEVAPFGFSREKIGFCVVLEPDGALHQVEDLRREVETGGKSKKTRPVPRRMVVPDRGGRSGTLLKPNFLWDNTGYALGRDGKGNPDRSRETFDAFRELHRQMAERVDDPGLQTLCRFLGRWKPQQADSLISNWEEVCDSNLVFRLRGEHAYLHDSPAVREAWLHFREEETESQRGVSLITGEEEDLARLHPMIQGVAGAQSSGAALASFNLNAFTSFGKEQSYNAPVGIRDAFRYTTALNRLLADRRRYFPLGDATVVFWSDRPTQFETIFGPIMDESASEDQAVNDRVRGFLNRLREGLVGDDLADADARFYILGLSPNASRLSVRYWLAGLVKDFAQRLAQHVSDLQMTGARPDAPPLMIRRLVLETARPKNNKPDWDSISPLLAGAVTRAVLSGGAYPQTLFCSVIYRIQADGRVHHRRAAILKAFLVRKSRIAGRTKEVSVSLNKNDERHGYQLGRLFAVLEKTQEEAYDNKLNTTIKDRFFSSASANPIAAFPRLMRLHSHHLDKIDHPGRRTNLEKLVQEIYSHIDGFPHHLPLEDQGLFFIGYYHQREDLFTKKSDKSDTDNANNQSKEN